MRTYFEQPLSESQCQALDAGEKISGPTLFDHGLNPVTAELLGKIRAIRTRERWAEIARNTDLASEEERRLICLVWETLPGDTCFMDAARLVAFGPRNSDMARAGALP